LSDSAIFYLQAKRYEVSDSFFEKALTICFNGTCKNLSVYGGRLAQLLYYWGKAHSERGEWNAAGNLYNKAWKVYMVLPAVYRNDANFLALMIDYGFLYDRCKLPQKAEEMYTSALPIIDKLKNKYKGKYDFEETLLWYNLGVVYDNLNLNDKSEEAYQKSLSLGRKLPDQHSERIMNKQAETLSNLGNLYSSRNQKRKAIALFEEALRLKRELIKIKEAYLLLQPPLPSALEAIGSEYYFQGLIRKSEPYFTEELELVRSLKEEHPEYELKECRLLEYLGDIHYKFSSEKQGEEEIQAAVDIARRNKGADSLTYKLFLFDGLSKLMYFNSRRENNYGETLLNLEEMVSLSRDLMKTDTVRYSSRLRMDLRDLTRICLFAKRPELAERYAKQYLALPVDRSERFWAWNLSELRSNLATAFLFQGRYEEAERLYGELKNELDDLGRPLRKELLRRLKYFESKGSVSELYKGDFERMKVFLSLK